MGVDLGGTKIELAVLDASGREMARRRVPTPHSGYDAALEILAREVLAMEREAGGPCTVGIGMPGVVSPRSGRVANAYNTPYNGRRLKHDLETRLAREVRFANDANCFALSERSTARRRARGWSSGRSSGPASAAALPSTERCWRGATASPASGDMSRSRG